MTETSFWWCLEGVSGGVGEEAVGARGQVKFKKIFAGTHETTASFDYRRCVNGPS